MMPLQIARFAFITSLPTAYAQVAPLIVVALSIDAMVLVIWYYLGVMINNRGVKASALNEFYQLIGTVILIGLVVGILVMSESVFSTALNNNPNGLMSHDKMVALCNNVHDTSSLDIIGRGSSGTNPSGTDPSLLYGPTGPSGNFPGICNMLTPDPTDLTMRLDYPLAATSVIIANLTNQTAANMNYSFIYDSYVGFLAQFRPTVNICIDPVEAISCIPNPVKEAPFVLHAEFAPYVGFGLLLKNLNLFFLLMNLSVQSFIAQLLFVTIFLYVWPWLLFVGILFRSTFFTRRIGGLMVAIVIGGLLIFPTVYSIEYLSLANGIKVAPGSGSPNGFNTTYQFNALTTLVATPDKATFDGPIQPGTMNGN